MRSLLMPSLFSAIFAALSGCGGSADFAMKGSLFHDVVQPTQGPSHTPTPNPTADPTPEPTVEPSPERTVQPPPGYSCAQAVRTLDFNLDGNPDLAVSIASSTGERIAILEGDGSGYFEFVSDFPAGHFGPFNRPLFVDAADLDGDGWPDLVLAQSPWKASGPCCNQPAGGITVHMGDGTGSFELSEEIDLGRKVLNVKLADVDRDGNPDAVVGLGPVNDWKGGIGVLLGDGLGGFEEDLWIVETASFAFPLAIADVDGDDRPDIVSAYDDGLGLAPYSPMANEIHVFKGEHTGLNDPERISLGPACENISVQGIALGDLDGDGAPDLVANVDSCGRPHCWDNGVSIVFNSSGTFPNEPISLMTVEHNPFTFVSLGDVNGDGLIDIAVNNNTVQPEGVGGVWVFLNQGNGVFPQEPDEIVPAFGYPMFLLEDINGDGIADLVTPGDCADHAVSVFLGSVQGFGEPVFSWQP